MASGVYNQFKTEIMNKEIDLVADDIKVALLDNSHSFTQTAVGWAASSTNANELAATGGYSAGGESLGTKVVSQESTHGKYTAANVSWTSATFSAYHAVIYDDTPASPAKPLICSIDFSGIQSVSSGTFTIQWAAGGIITIT